MCPEKTLRNPQNYHYFSYLDFWCVSFLDSVYWLFLQSLAIDYLFSYVFKFGYLCYCILLIQIKNPKGPNFHKLQSKSGNKTDFHFADLFFHKSDFGLDQMKQQIWTKFTPKQQLPRHGSWPWNWCPCKLCWEDKVQQFFAEKLLRAPHLPGTRADLPLDSPGNSLHGLLAFS